MKKEDFNTIYMISLVVVGFVFFLLRDISTKLGYVGLGLIVTGLSIGLFEVIKKEVRR
jgi:hypothetical protein